MRSETGIKFAMDCVREAVESERMSDLHFWAALPCTGGSPWQQVNKRYASARIKIEKHIQIFHELFFQILGVW